MPISMQKQCRTGLHINDTFKAHATLWGQNKLKIQPVLSVFKFCIQNIFRQTTPPSPNYCKEATVESYIPNQTPQK